MHERIEAADFNEPPEMYGVSGVPSGYALLARRMRQAAIEVHGDLDTRFTDEEEQALAVSIEVGHNAKETLERNRTSSESVIEEYEQLIAKGREAQHTLVVANLRFAAYYARLSMNITPARSGKSKSQGDTVGDEPDLTAGDVIAGMDVKFRGGAYADIKLLASKHANLDDRTQVAMEALIGAAASYRVKTDRNGRRVTFRSHMGYRIHSALADYSKTIEKPGWQLGMNDIGYLSAARRHPEDVSPHRLAELQRRIAGAEAVSWDHVELHKPAPDEYENDWYPRQPLTLADVYADPAYERIAKHLGAEALSDAIGKLFFEVLSEREAGVIRLRYGMLRPDPESHDTYERTRSLREIGEVYGATPERIRQIVDKTLKKLREPSVHAPLTPYVAAEALLWGTENRITPYIPDAMPPLRTERLTGMAASRNHIAVDTTAFDVEEARYGKNGSRVASTAHDEWDGPSRLTPIELAAQYEYIGVAFSRLLYRSGDYHYQRSFAQDMQSEYPKGLAAIINEQLGRRLTVGHLEQFWNEKLMQFNQTMQRRRGDDFDVQRMPALWSYLVAERMRDQDAIEITIPHELNGKLHCIGAWLRHGRLTVHGNVADFAGYKLGGLADLYIKGSVGDYAAMGAHRYAQMTVTGDAGSFFAAQSNGAVHLRVNGRVADNCAYESTGRDSLIIIEGGAGAGVAEMAQDIDLVIGGKRIDTLPRSA
jgi:RNA polymerase sigma factor (sigma-70 family)